VIIEYWFNPPIISALYIFDRWSISISYRIYSHFYCMGVNYRPFPLPVNVERNVAGLKVNGRHLWFTTYPDNEQHHLFTACFMALKTCHCRWNCAAIMCISWDTCNYIISAAILNLWLPVSSGSVTDSTIEKFDPENIGIELEISFLSIIQAEIHVFHERISQLCACCCWASRTPVVTSATCRMSTPFSPVNYRLTPLVFIYTVMKAIEFAQ